MFNRTVSAKPAKPARSTAAVSKQPGKTWILLDETGDSWALGRTMKAFVSVLVIGSGVLVSCVHANHTVEIPVQGVTATSPDALVRVAVPADWRPFVPSPSRAEFLAPDQWSRVYLRAMPAEVDLKHCPTLARRYASEFIDAWGGPPRTRVANKISSGDTVDFELRRADPKPGGEIIWARVVCREGALAIASCTVPTPREQQLKPRCRGILESLQVVARPKPLATASTR